MVALGSLEIVRQCRRDGTSTARADSRPWLEILSDDASAALLKQRGCDVARRTAVKYREAMGIGSSIQRRRMRKIAG